jgi:TadE-like protein
MTPSRRGASALEFALLLPIFIVLVGGLMDFAWYFQQRNLVVRAVREGVRVGATTALAATPNPGDTALSRTGDVLDELGLNRDESTLTIEYDDIRAGLTCNTDDTITLRAEVPFTPIAGIVPTPADITVQMTMMLEDGDCA